MLIRELGFCWYDEEFGDTPTVDTGDLEGRAVHVDGVFRCREPAEAVEAVEDETGDRVPGAAGQLDAGRFREVLQVQSPVHHAPTPPGSYRVQVFVVAFRKNRTDRYRCSSIPSIRGARATSGRDVTESLSWNY